MICFRQEFFTSEIVAELKSEERPILFISDIRTADYKILNPDEVETAVEEDQRLQEEWVRDLCPKASLLKFRLPWRDGETKYLDGIVLLPIWGRETTTETRLVVQDPHSSRVYDNKKYEEQLFYFNRRTRVQYYTHPCQAEGMDHCYDCAAEVVVLSEYLRRYYRFDPTGESKLMDYISAMSKRISSACSTSGRTLALREEYSERQQWFSPRLYDYGKRKMINK